MNNKYDDFYTDLIKTWKTGGSDGGEGGWAQYYYGIFSRIINENNFKNCAEVGLGYGFHAKQILESTNLSRLYLIDPMLYYTNDQFVVDVMSYGGFEKLVKNINIHLEPHKDTYTWFRQPSLSITQEQIPDGSLDAVFIDGDHSYDAVIKDLLFWWKKIRVGGWLLGDDYASCHPETTKAVNDFASNNNLQLELIYKKTYPIYKFIKK